MEICPVERSSLPEFLVHVEAHLSENGDNGFYFAPRPKGDRSGTASRAERFATGLTLPVGSPGWCRMWIAKTHEGLIAGHLELQSHPFPHAEHRCVLGMGVERTHRSKGIGSRLIGTAEQWAVAQERLEWIDLRVLSDNHRAIRLYERCGYQKNGEISDLFRIDGLHLGDFSMAKRVRGF